MDSIIDIQYITLLELYKQNYEKITLIKSLYLNLLS